MYAPAFEKVNIQVHKMHTLWGKEVILKTKFYLIMKSVKSLPKKSAVIRYGIAAFYIILGSALFGWNF